MELRSWALQCLLEPDPAAKVAAVAAMATAHAEGRCPLDMQAALQSCGEIPGRPALPELVAPRLVGRRSMASVEGRAMLIHALAHIEFNAVNLALDAVWRFPGMPEQFYLDWLRVAKEEAYHFSLLSAHLQTQGSFYGAYTAHGSLWEMVAKTSGDVLARMALVPRTLEARGLDAIPPLRAKLMQAGDEPAALILDIILHDEVGHVEIGNRWYWHMCKLRGVDPIATYDTLVVQYKASVRGPFNMEARRRAGFTEAELQALTSAAAATAAPRE